MTYTGAPCGAHLSEFDVDRSSDGDGESRSAHTPKVVRRWEIGAPKRFDCADFMELDRSGAKVNATLVVSERVFRRGCSRYVCV